MKSVRPSFLRTDYQSQRIIHREKVSKLTTPGTGAYSVLGSFPLNPGMALTFPWLANEAQGWESYRFNRLRFIWVPTSGTATVGNIIMGPDYDAADEAPAAESFFSSYTNTEESNVWARFASDLDPDLLNGEQKRKFIRNGALDDNLDIKTYDSGTFYVASTDDAAANTGKLWVEYDVSLFNPQVPPGGFQGTGTLTSSATGISTTVPFGDSPTATGPIALSVDSATPTVVEMSGLQIGQEILVSILYQGTGITALSISAVSGLTAVSGAIANIINVGGTAAARVSSFVVTSQAPNFTLGTTETTATNTFVAVSVLAPRPNF